MQSCMVDRNVSMQDQNVPVQEQNVPMQDQNVPVQEQNVPVQFMLESCRRHRGRQTSGLLYKRWYDTTIGTPRNNFWDHDLGISLHHPRLSQILQQHKRTHIVDIDHLQVNAIQSTRPPLIENHCC